MAIGKERRTRIQISKSIFPRKKDIHPFDWSLAMKWGALAALLTAVYIFTELTSPVTFNLLLNMAISIVGLGAITALFLTAARARRLVQDPLQ